MNIDDIKDALRHMSAHESLTDALNELGSNLQERLEECPGLKKMLAHEGTETEEAAFMLGNLNAVAAITASLMKHKDNSKLGVITFNSSFEAAKRNYSEADLDEEPEKETYHQVTIEEVFQELEKFKKDIKKDIQKIKNNNKNHEE